MVVLELIVQLTVHGVDESIVEFDMQSMHFTLDLMIQHVLHQDKVVVGDPTIKVEVVWLRMHRRESHREFGSGVSRGKACVWSVVW